MAATRPWWEWEKWAEPGPHAVGVATLTVAGPDDRALPTLVWCAWT
jgi:hypothetical protein